LFVPGRQGKAAWTLEGIATKARVIRVAGAQMGPIQQADPRALTLERLMALLEEAAARGAELVVFPELAFTTFFPRWLVSALSRPEFRPR
jgi:predicted amidohydrolase